MNKKILVLSSMILFLAGNYNLFSKDNKNAKQIATANVGGLVKTIDDDKSNTLKETKFSKFLKKGFFKNIQKDFKSKYFTNEFYKNYFSYLESNFNFDYNRVDMGLIADKSDFRMILYDLDGQVIKSYPICVGKDKGQKRTFDDKCTPEGVFWIAEKEHSTEKKYGPRILTYDGPGAWYPYEAIHGTPLGAAWTIGKERSLGCIRMYDKDVKEIYELVELGCPLIIKP